MSDPLYRYCGECKKCSQDKFFEICTYCEDEFKHKSGHGYYCTDCDKKYLRKRIYRTIKYKIYLCDQCNSDWKENKLPNDYEDEKINKEEKLEILHQLGDFPEDKPSEYKEAKDKK